jgi:hypothetical protein
VIGGVIRFRIFSDQSSSGNHPPPAQQEPQDRTAFPSSE